MNQADACGASTMKNKGNWTTYKVRACPVFLCTVVVGLAAASAQATDVVRTRQRRLL